MDIIDTVYDSISHFGPLARTIDDAALFIDVTQGTTPVDIQTIPRCDIPIPTPTEIRNLKIAIDVDLGFYAVHPGVEANLWQVVDALRDGGAIVEEVDLGWEKRLQDIWYQGWLVYLAAAFKAHFGDSFEEKRDLMDPHLASRIEEGFKLDAVTVRMWEFERTQYWQSLANVLERHDALLCPTVPITAPSNEANDLDFDHIDSSGKVQGSDMTTIFNCFSQCPALSVPSGFVNGMPTAAQIITRKWDDPLALRIGAAIEAAMPWVDHRPSI